MKMKTKRIITLLVAIVIVCMNIIKPSALNQTSDIPTITYCASGDEGRLLMTWNNTGASGYELMLSQNNIFTRNTQVLEYNQDVTKASLKNMIPNAMYYIKVRSVNVENGSKTYSNWSDVTSIRIHAHNYERTMVQKATCNSDGVYTFICTGCGRYYKEYTNATGTHNYQWVDNGNDTMSYKCTDCGTVKETRNCDYKLVNTTNATCENDGSKEYKCNSCGATKTEIITKLGHNYKLTNETSTEKTYTCKNCNATYTEKKEIIKDDTKDDTKEDIKEDIKEEPVEQEYTVNLKNGETTTVVGYFDREMADEIFTQLNEYRTSKGLPTLKQGSDALQWGADVRGTEIAKSFSHTRPNGERALTSLTGATGCCAENLAKYQESATQVMTDWKNSAGHNANMISKYPKSVSISVFVKCQISSSGKKLYSYHFVQLFGW